MQSFFVWNGIDCRAMGINLHGPVPIIRPEERVKHKQIPGVSGDLTETEGADIYNSYIQTASISVKGGFRVRDIYKWLRGDGYVTFSGEPDRKQKARVIGAITLNRISRNMDKHAGEIQFYCQPLKELLHEEKVTVNTSGETVRNNGDVICRPMYKVTASDTSFTLTVAGTGTPANNSITLSSITSGHVYWIDAESMEVWNSTFATLRTKKSTGNFPVMGVGNNTITFSGLSSVEIERRERYL